MRLSSNLTSTFDDPHSIQSKLEDDLRLRRVVPTQPTFPFVSSPLGLVPNTTEACAGFTTSPIHKEAPSRPHSPTIHSNPICYRGRFFDLVVQGRRHCLIVKKDIKDAFRIIPIAFNQRWLLGFEWEGS